MNRNLLVILLSELKTVRILCRGPQCRTVMEMPLEELWRHRHRDQRCPHCNADWNPMHLAASPLTEFARLALALQELQMVFDLEFVLPVAEGAV